MSDNNNTKDANKDEILTNIDSYLTFIKFQFHTDKNKDVVVRELTIAENHRAFIVFIDGMVDRSVINNFILRPLMSKFSFTEDNREKWYMKDKDAVSLDYVLNNVIEVNQAEIYIDPQDIIYQILLGNTIIFVDGNAGAIGCETKGYDKRGIDKPQTEGVVKGPHEGFSENLRSNTSLIRRIVKNKDLVTEFTTVGDKNNAYCAILYIDGLVNDSIVEEVKRRIKNLKTDYINETGILQQFIEDSPSSIFPTMLSTERPDRAAANLTEGRVIVLVEGSPSALVMPITFLSMIHSPEDFSLKWQYATLLRVIRIMAIIFGTLLPGLYVAITNFHIEMIPTDLLLAIAKAREQVPFPTIIEIALMEFSFELIREAGIRIPGLIGNTIGIIGALILGQAAVEANLVSPILIIIIAFTGLANLANPDFNLAFGVRILRFIFIILGAVLGFYGISLGIILTLALLTTTKSFGVPLLAPYSPVTHKGKDLIIRRPVWKQERRPDELNTKNVNRQPKISRLWTLSKEAKDFYITPGLADKSHKRKDSDKNGE